MKKENEIYNDICVQNKTIEHLLRAERKQSSE